MKYLFLAFAFFFGGCAASQSAMESTTQGEAAEKPETQDEESP